MRFGLPQPFSRSADVLSGGVQRGACRSAALLAADGKWVLVAVLFGFQVFKQ